MLNTAFLKHDILYPHPRSSHVLGLCPLHIYLCSSYLEASKPFFLLSESKIFIFGLLSEVVFLVIKVLFSFGMNQWHTLPALLTKLHFSLLSLASSSCAFDLCYHNKQVLQTLQLQSVLREVSHSTCLAFCSIFASCWVIFPVSPITTIRHHFINLTSICEHEETGKTENSNWHLIVQKSPGLEEGKIKDWKLPSMTLISNCIETHRESSLHLFPTKRNKRPALRTLSG